MKIISSLAMAGLVSLCLVSNALAHAPFAQNVSFATNAIQNIIGPEHGDMICASIYADCLYSTMSEQIKNNPVLWNFAVVESAAVNQCINAMNGGKCRPLCQKNRVNSISVPWSFENGQEMEIAFGCIEHGTKIDFTGCKSTQMPFTVTVEFDSEIPFFVAFCQFDDTFEAFGLTDVSGLPLKASMDENGDISCLGLEKGESDVFEDSAPTLLPACIEDTRFHFYGCPQYELLTIKNTGDKCVVDVKVELQPTNGV